MTKHKNQVPMKTLLVIATALIVGGWMYSDLYVTPAPMSTIAQQTETSAPLDASTFKPVRDFSYADINGQKGSLAKWRGKTVLVSLWASWCAPCVTEFPALVDFAAGRDDVVLLALSADNSVADIRKFIAKQDDHVRQSLKKNNVIVALDKGRDIARGVFSTERYPEAFFITPEGQIARKVIGATDWHAPEFEQFADQLSALKSH